MSSSSVVTATVEGYPSTVIAPESPTSTRSTPAASAARALGKSYAVTMTIGAPRRFMSTRRGSVTGRRSGVAGTTEIWLGCVDMSVPPGLGQQAGDLMVDVDDRVRARLHVD